MIFSRKVGVDAATNQVVWQWHPDAFGIKQPVETGAEINLRFPGQYYDKPTGLYYNLNRYYDPKLGRYWEPDPLGLEAGLNPYVYAENDPVNNVDPTGLSMVGTINSNPNVNFMENFDGSIDNTQFSNPSNYVMMSSGNDYHNTSNSGLWAQNFGYVGPNYMQQFNDLYNYAGQQIKKGIYSVGETANTVGDYATIPFPAAGLPLKYTGLGLMFATTDTPKALALQEGVGLVGGFATSKLTKLSTTSPAYSQSTREVLQRIMELYGDKTAKFGCGVLVNGCR